MPDEAPEAQDQPNDEAAPTDVDQAPAAEEKPEVFSDNFDPASLPDELRPAYQQLRADYTRKTQEIGQRNKDQILQQALQDQEFQRQAAEAWGIGYEDEEDDDAYFEPDDELRQEVAELRKWRDEFTQAQTQQQQQQAIVNHIDTQIDGLETRLGRELSDKEADLLGNLSLQYPDTDGLPDVDAAYDEFAEILAENRKSYTSKKRRAPRAPAGQSGSQKVNLKDPQERRRAMAEAVEAVGDDD